MKNLFVQEMIILSHIGLNIKIVCRVIKPNGLFILAKNIENVWVDSKPNSISYVNIIYNVRDCNDWYSNIDELKNQINIKTRIST